MFFFKVKIRVCSSSIKELGFDEVLSGFSSVYIEKCVIVFVYLHLTLFDSKFHFSRPYACVVLENNKIFNCKD